MSMDRSEVIAFVDKNLKKYMDVMGIPHWNIIVSYEHIRVDGESVDAQVDCNAPYNQAHIRIDPERMEDDGYLAKVIVHELAHIVLSPFDVYRAYHCAADVPDTPEDKREREMWRYCVEQGVINVMRVYQGLVAHYRDGADATRNP